MFACLSSRSERGQHPSRPPIFKPAKAKQSSRVSLTDEEAGASPVAGASFLGNEEERLIRLPWKQEIPERYRGARPLFSASDVQQFQHAALPKRSSGCNSRLAHQFPPPWLEQIRHPSSKRDRCRCNSGRGFFFLCAACRSRRGDCLQTSSYPVRVRGGAPFLSA
jgi:hypothetical protein